MLPSTRDRCPESQKVEMRYYHGKGFIAKKKAPIKSVGEYNELAGVWNQGGCLVREIRQALLH